MKTISKISNKNQCIDKYIMTLFINNCNSKTIFDDTSGCNPVFALYSVDWPDFVLSTSSASMPPTDFFAVTLYPTVTKVFRK